MTYRTSPSSLVAGILAATLSITATTSQAADRVLGTARLADNGDVSLGDGLRLGRYQDGRFVATPGAIEVGGLRILAESTVPPSLPIESADQSDAGVGRSFFRTASPSGRSRMFVGHALSVDAGGAGVNGPLAADYGQRISVVKRGFPASTAAVGELDVLALYGRQSGPTPTSETNSSDFDGIQGNFAAVGDPGYFAAAELLVSRTTAPTYAVTHSLGIQMGVNDPWGKNNELGISGDARYTSGVNRLTFAYGALANTGALDRAFYATCSPEGTWQDYLMGGSGTAPDIRIKGCGSATPGALVFGSGASTATLWRDPATNRVTLQSNTGPREEIQRVPGAWTQYTPTISSSGGAPTAATATARYELVGKTLRVRFQVDLTTPGPAGGILTATLPPGLTTAAGPFAEGSGRDNANGNPLVVYAASGATTLNIYTATVPQSTAVAAGASLHGSITLEVQ